MSHIPPWIIATISKLPNSEQFSLLSPQKCGIKYIDSISRIFSNKRKLKIQFKNLLPEGTLTTEIIWRIITNVVLICLKFGSVTVVSGNVSLFPLLNWDIVSENSSLIGVGVGSKENPFKIYK